MAVAACGCGCVREGDNSWLIVNAAAGCPHAHQGGERGFAEGVPARVTGVGECVTVVFDRQSRTAMLLTPTDSEGGSAVVRPARRPDDKAR